MTNHEIIDAEFVETEPSAELAHRAPEPNHPPFLGAMMTDTLGVLGMQRELLLAQHRALYEMLRQMGLPVCESFASGGTSESSSPPGSPRGAPIHIMENNMRAMDRAIESIMSSLRHGFGLHTQGGPSHG